MEAVQVWRAKVFVRAITTWIRKHTQVGTNENRPSIEQKKKRRCATSHQQRNPTRSAVGPGWPITVDVFGNNQDNRGYRSEQSGEGNSCSVTEVVAEEGSQPTPAELRGNFPLLFTP